MERAPANGERRAVFSARDLACRHCGRVEMHPLFLTRREAVLQAMGRPLVVASGYRCPEHDAARGGSGAHTTGRAVDIRICGADAYRLVATAMRHGFTGIGVGQSAATAARTIHLDDLCGGRLPRPRIWNHKEI